MANEFFGVTCSPESCVSEPFRRARLDRFVQFVNHSAPPVLNFDPAYLDFLHLFHGGVPDKSQFSTSVGTPRVVERFLNWLPGGENNPDGSFSVPHIWSVLCHRLGNSDEHHFIPFAETFAGNYLCFDIQEHPHPVVLWLHEESTEDSPVCEPVSPGFVEFLKLLHDKSCS